MYTHSNCSGESVYMRRLAWTFAAHRYEKYQLDTRALAIGFIAINSEIICFRIYFRE